MSKNRVSRRTFIQGLGAAGLASALPATAAKGAGTPPLPAAGGPGDARNLIFLVVDGMCAGTLGLAHHFHARESEKPLEWIGLYGLPGIHQAAQDTRSASSPVTDSAAAASAWGSGERTVNGRLNYGVDGKPRTPLYTLAREAGKATGLVTTCRYTHATPAGFAVNVRDRNNEVEVARQYLDRKVDVLLGGGMEILERRDAEGLLDRYKAAGYHFATNRRELSAAPAEGPLLGVFSDSHVPYAIDRANDPELAGVPGLDEMFKAALARLKGASAGFVLQVEGGRVDHAGHANDPGAILHDQLEFDRCIRTALDFIDSNPDTLLIVTTDHGTGGCQLNGLGPAYSLSGRALEQLAGQKLSLERLGERFRATGKADPALFKETLGFELSADVETAINRGIADDVGYLSSVISSNAADSLFQNFAVGWSSNNHTSENVELFAVGPGADRVGGFMLNNEVFGVMTGALGLG